MLIGAKVIFRKVLIDAKVSTQISQSIAYIIGILHPKASNIEVSDGLLRKDKSIAILTELYIKTKYKLKFSIKN